MIAAVETIAKQITRLTVRIVCEMPDGSSSIGTGFFFNLFKTRGLEVPVIVTNRHVVEGSPRGEIQLNSNKADGNTTSGARITIKVPNFGKVCLMHPDKKIDLCILPLGAIIQLSESKGMIPTFVQFGPSMIPSNKELYEITAAEDIIMVGYPHGIWDERNNMPIVRKGITATHPYLDYEGKEEFVVDVAVFPGSSGSPILLYNPNGHRNRANNWDIRPRIKLLGVLWGTPVQTEEGEIKIVDIPTTQKPVALFKVYNNLGFAIKARKILDFVPLMEKLLDDPGPDLSSATFEIMP